MTPACIERGFEERDRAVIVALLREYEAGLSVSLCFQGFEAELAGLPGDYAPPRGAMLLARSHEDGAALLGMVALRSVGACGDLCEMKRLYVHPVARGQGLGRSLALAVMAAAVRLGYRRMCLDTLPGMREAQALYRSLGFRPAGTGNSEPKVLLFERELPRHEP
jgi:ribosomal protein S18 acetylase RimI-like enzyme